jgi:hypothetical protein
MVQPRSFRLFVSKFKITSLEDLPLDLNCVLSSCVMEFNSCGAWHVGILAVGSCKFVHAPTTPRTPDQSISLPCMHHYRKARNEERALMPGFEDRAFFVGIRGGSRGGRGNGDAAVGMYGELH